MIHPSAEVSKDVRIGNGSRIWDSVRIREGAAIGKECIVGRGAYIDTGVIIGDRVKIQNNALVYSGTHVASGVFIGPSAILTNDRYPRAVTTTGELAAGDDWTVSEIHLGEGCSVGAGAVVVAGSDVGPYATIGAGAVVTREVPAFGLVVGNPARQIGWVCRCGGRLADDDGRRVDGVFEGDACCPRDGTRFAITGSNCTELGVR